MAFAQQGVRVCAVRLSPSTHGRGDVQRFVPRMMKVARARGVSGYLDDANPVWPAVHRLDAAVLFRLAFEKGVSGKRYHAVAEEGVAVADIAIAKAVGDTLGLPCQGMSTEKAREHFDDFAMFASIDQRASSENTRRELGWQPKQLGLLDDVRQNYGS